MRGSIWTSAVALSVLIAPATLASSSWEPVGGGMDSSVDGIAIAANGDVVAVGYFEFAGGDPASRVARWNGSTWSPLGSGVDDDAQSIAVAPNGDFIVGGAFENAGGATANYIARWDGSNWSPFGTSPNGLGNSVSSVAVDSNGIVYAGGRFDATDTPAINHIAKWNGSSWSSLGTGANDDVGAVAVDANDDLYIGGTFTDVDSTANTSRIAKWDASASTWSALGIGMNDEVRSIAFDSQGNVYAGGTFTTAGGNPAGYIAKWDGSNWSALGAGMDARVRSIVVDAEDNVYAAGDFTTAGGVSANRVAMWDGSSWSAVGDGIANNGVFELALSPTGDLYAGGNFSTAGGSVADYFAVYQSAAEPTAVGGIGAAPEFTFSLPDGRECTSISPEVVRLNTFYELPGAQAECRDDGSVITGWRIKGQEWAFEPGRKVWVIESQQFTAVLEYDWVRIDYDSNVAADTPCLADGSNLPLAERTAVTHIPRESITDQVLWDAPVCVPAGYEFIGWTDRRGEVPRLLNPDDALMPAPAVDSDGNAANTIHLYATWRPTGT